jgi:hypothetical protein
MIQMQHVNAGSIVTSENTNSSFRQGYGKSKTGMNLQNYSKDNSSYQNQPTNTVVPNGQNSVSTRSSAGKSKISMID